MCEKEMEVKEGFFMHDILFHADCIQSADSVLFLSACFA